MDKTIDRDWLIAQVAGMIEDEEDIDPGENLTLYGLDSISVMRLLAELERHGIRLTMLELAHEPSIDAWWALIEPRQAA
ncbi:phosphopantetheine-binding protein [Paracoccus ravus]|uniref:phosphopantetheine-binding protein n=1 Tax=Paracoccus ravus TaxID=2447760 RepID=UPI00106E30F4|nr:phosphopantetheine-binding protein [Paracoccus ravus]